MVGEVAVQLVTSLRGVMAVKDICLHFGIARFTYYRWKQASTDARSRQAIEKRICELCRAYKFRYGYRKIKALLRQEMGMNHKVVQRIMQKYGWQCRVKVKKRKRTGQPYAIAANLLNRDFEATAPLQKLVTDKPEFKKISAPSGTHEEWPAFLVFFQKAGFIMHVYNEECVS